jgi:aryl-alcohol dehydrogenase-like predicted oxidoreductase
MSTVIPGMRNVTQVEANIAVSDLPSLPQPLLAGLRKHIWLRGNWHEGK